MIAEHKGGDSAATMYDVRNSDFVRNVSST